MGSELPGGVNRYADFVACCGKPHGRNARWLWKISKRGILILVVAMVLGLCLSSIALAERTWSVAAILVVMGAAAGMLNVHIGAWAMKRIDIAVRGRVSPVRQIE